MKMKIQHAQRSDLGKIRNNNEDDFVLKTFTDNNSILLIGAIDGVGGYEGGEIATEIAKKTIEEYYDDIQVVRSETPVEEIKKAVRLANNKIRQQRNENPDLHRMGCVISVAFLNAEEERLYFAHVGDSRGYVYRDGKLEKFTKDHSLVGFLEDSNEITEEEAMNHPRRNEIYQLLGEKELSEDNTYIQSGSYSFYAGDIALFCSDGLTDLVNSSSIIETLSKDISLEDKKEELIAKANEKGGKDNITVALAYYEGERLDNEKTLILVDENKKEVLETSKEDIENAFLPQENLDKSSKKSDFLKYVMLILLIVVIGGVLFFFKDRIIKKEVSPIKPNEVQKADTLNNTKKVEKDTLNIVKDNIQQKQKKEPIDTVGLLEKTEKDVLNKESIDIKQKKKESKDTVNISIKNKIEKGRNSPKKKN